MKTNNTFHPLVSIVIPVYNGSNFLSQAIDSALKQTYKNIEIIVVNDGSNDSGASAKIAKSYGKKIRYFEKPNGGVATALNMGIQKMRGAYFSWLSHDDLYLPDKIAIQIEFYKRYPEKRDAILYSDFCTINEKGLWRADVKIKDIHSELFIYELINSHPVHGCSLLIPRKCFSRKHPFNPELRTTQDYTLWFELAQKFHFIHLNKILIKSRIHSGQDTLRRPATVEKENNKMYFDFLRALPKIHSKMNTDISISDIYFNAALGLINKNYLKTSNIAYQKYLIAEKNFFIKTKNILRYKFCNFHHKTMELAAKIKRWLFTSS